LLGPSGCGKTTLLKLINRLIEPDSGSIRIGGQLNTSLEKHVLRRNIGYVIQDVGLLPHLNIQDNISMVNRIDKNPLSTDRLKKLLELTGLEEDLLSKQPSQLSGGQQQRVGIARALANDPDLILMDEPFSALDNITRNQLQDDFLSLEVLNSKTIIMVTHDVQEAFKLGDRIVLLNEGVIQQVGTPEQFLTNPTNAFVESFLAKDKLQLFLHQQQIPELLDDPTIDASQKKKRLNEALKSLLP